MEEVIKKYDIEDALMAFFEACERVGSLALANRMGSIAVDFANGDIAIVLQVCRHGAVGLALEKPGPCPLDSEQLTLLD